MRETSSRSSTQSREVPHLTIDHGALLEGAAVAAQRHQLQRDEDRRERISEPPTARAATAPAPSARER